MGPAGAEPARAAETPHCVLEVNGVSKDGSLRTATPQCFPTFAEAMKLLGLETRDGGTPQRAEDFDRLDAETVAAAGVIGIHYDGSNRTGASISVSGADCAGGYIDLSSAWVNRITSTRNFCPSTVFFDGFDKGGAAETTNLASMNLGGLADRANSIAYGS